MTSPMIALLADRGVVRIAGEDAGRLLQGVISNDMELLASSPAIHAALLSPQGKILFEFFVVKDGAGFLLETRRDRAADLVKRLTMYKLRAKVTIADESGQHRLMALWGEWRGGGPLGFLCYPDPRLSDLGLRLIARGAPPDLADLARGLGAVIGDWQAHRIGLGIPESEEDYRLGDAYPHEADFDLLNGVSFSKGCFVGQEVVSRMHNRSAVRKRIVPITANGPLASGMAISAGPAVIGTVASVAGKNALAMLRLDRAAQAKAKGEPLLAAGAEVTLRSAKWAVGELPVAVAP